jgi:stage II sporulation protein AA (anti-sigma F factor antagonist)
MDPQHGTLLRLHGELDEDGCAAVRRQLASDLSHGVRHVLLDLADVTELSLAGVHMLRCLDEHLRGRQGGLLLLKPSDAVRSTLKINELDNLLAVGDLAPAPQQALASVLPLVRRTQVAQEAATWLP